MTQADGVSPSLERYRALAQSADPGPWFVDGADADNCTRAMFLARGEYKRGRWPQPEHVVAITLLQYPFIAVSDRSNANAEFIAAARDGVPWLCDQVEQVSTQRDRLADALRRVLTSAVAEEGASVRVAQEPLDEARALLASIDNA